MSNTIKWMPKGSLGAKAILVCALTLVMVIPALFVAWLLSDRSDRAEDVYREVGQLHGGEQRVLGPVLAIPYETKSVDTVQKGYVYGFAQSGSFEAQTQTSTLKRSIFEVPVYKADIEMLATFDLEALRVAMSDDLSMAVDWSRAELILGVHDLRGVRSEPTIQINGQVLDLKPVGGGFPVDTRAAPRPMPHGGSWSGGHALTWSVMAAALPSVDVDKLQVSGRVVLNGVESISLAPFAQTTTASLSGDWPHPSFQGGFLPTTRQIDDHGFKADWSVPFVARGLSGTVTDQQINVLDGRDMAVAFVWADNPYQSVGRALKYAIVFVGLVFLTFFLFEALGKRRVHAAQYVLIGLAQTVFYLLLLSIAEFWGFDLAFAVAATATVGLISAYAGWTFKDRNRGLTALVVFSGLYALIYILMRLEDYALLVGAVVTFLAIASAMVLTRNLDWYGDDNG